MEHEDTAVGKQDTKTAASLKLNSSPTLEPPCTLQGRGEAESTKANAAGESACDPRTPDGIAPRAPLVAGLV